MSSKNHIVILTDSTWAIRPHLVKSYDIEVLPLTVHFKDEIYRDGIDLTEEEFLEKLNDEDEIPTTSQIPPGEFVVAFKQLRKEFDEVIGIFIADKLSGTYRSAMMAKELLNDDHIHIIDSNSVSLGLSHLTITAMKAREEGLEALEIVQLIEEIKHDLEFLFTVNSLDHLIKGGRLAPGKATIGKMLRIKPIMELRDGEIHLIKKVTGKKAAVNAIYEHILEETPDANFPMAFGEFGCKKELDKLMDKVDVNTSSIETWVQGAGIVIGSHTGAGVYGCAYISQKNNSM